MELTRRILYGIILLLCGTEGRRCKSVTTAITVFALSISRVARRKEKYTEEDSYMKRINLLISVLLCAVLLMGAFAVSIYAEADNGGENTVTVRIEGITANIYFGEVQLQNIEKNTVLSVLSDLCKANDDLTITGLDEGFITKVNSDGSGLTETGWDGWMVRVNDVPAAAGIGELEVKAGDSIILYYSDEYVTGMQYPVCDDSELLSSGILKFTSTDTTYDEDFNPITNVNPVVGMSVVWTYGESEVTLVTDDNGCVTIDSQYLTGGDHHISVFRDSNGIPTVLRLAPDTCINIKAEEENTTAKDTSENTSEETTEESTNAQQTEAKEENNNAGCKSTVTIAIIPVLLMTALAFKKKK